MALDYTVKYASKIANRFKLASKTNRAAGHEYEFTGAKSVKIYSMVPAELTDYQRGGKRYPDIRILIVRREYPELEQGIIIPMRKMIPAELATYNGGMHMFTFYNGAIIKFGHYGSGDDVEYQGQEYDWIFIDEATQFTEEQFRTLGACLRGATKIPRRMYLTCNPGGIGHAWVKRLFIDREYQDGEKEKDYTFIHATVDDNPQLLEASPEYKQMLDLLPEDVRRAWRYGDWDALAGTFFPEFRKETHVIEPFARIPGEWKSTARSTTASTCSRVSGSRWTLRDAATSIARYSKAGSSFPRRRHWRFR